MNTKAKTDKRRNPKITTKEIANKIKDVFDSGVELKKPKSESFWYGTLFEYKTVRSKRELAENLRNGWFYGDRDQFLDDIAFAVINAYED